MSRAQLIPNNPGIPGSNAFTARHVSEEYPGHVQHRGLGLFSCSKKKETYQVVIILFQNRSVKVHFVTCLFADLLLTGLPGQEVGRRHLWLRLKRHAQKHWRVACREDYVEGWAKLSVSQCQCQGHVKNMPRFKQEIAIMKAIS